MIGLVQTLLSALNSCLVEAKKAYGFPVDISSAERLIFGKSPERLLVRLERWGTASN